MSDKQRAYLALHFCVLVWGFTAILGKLITLSTLPLVWWRVLICCGVLLVVVPREQWRAVPKHTFWRLLGVGMLVGVHWLCFYGAIKLSNASVAVTTMATTAFFASLVEPWVMRQRFKWYEMLLGVLILPGIALVVGTLDWSLRLGFSVGVVGAFLAALFTALNKRVLDAPNPPPALAMSLIELSGALAITSVGLLVTQPGWAALTPQPTDWLWLALLSVVCTLLPYYLTLQAMRHISAFATNLTINLEPVYGVVLASVLLREDRQLSTHFYIGVSVVLLAVFSHPFLKMRFEKGV